MTQVFSGKDIDSKKYWDPVSLELSPDEIAEHKQANTGLLGKFNYYKKHPHSIKFWMTFCVALSLSLIFFILVITYPFNGPAFLFIIYPIAIPLIYYFQIKASERQMANLLTAEEFGWLYAPKDTLDRWLALARIYPEFFENEPGEIEFIESERNNFYVGKPVISDEFWGYFNQMSFWSVCLENALKGDNAYTKRIYVFHLPRKVAHTFLLKPQQSDFTKQSSLTTESNDFNRNFHIFYEGDAGLVGADILEMLVPDVQEKLFDFRKNVGPFSLLFKGDVVMVSFDVIDRRLRYTNFFSKVALDPRDVEIISQKMTAIISLADAILPSIE